MLQLLLPDHSLDKEKIDIDIVEHGEQHDHDLCFKISNPLLAQLFYTALSRSGYCPRQENSISNTPIVLKSPVDISNYLVYLVGVDQVFLTKTRGMFIQARSPHDRFIDKILPYVKALLDPSLQQPLEGTPHKKVPVVVTNPIPVSYHVENPIPAVHAIGDAGKTEGGMLYMMNVARRALARSGPGAGNPVGAGAGATVPQHENTESKKDADHSEALNQALKDLLPALNRVVQIAEAHKPSDASAQQQTVDLAKALLAALTLDNSLKPRNA